MGGNFTRIFDIDVDHNIRTDYTNSHRIIFSDLSRLVYNKALKIQMTTDLLYEGKRWKKLYALRYNCGT